MEFYSVLTYFSTALVALASFVVYSRMQKKRKLKELQEDVIFNSETIDVGAPQKLLIHTKEFYKGVVTVKKNIHVAIGYGIANTILLEGTSNWSSCCLEYYLEYYLYLYIVL